jgi:hypothetical protein
MPMIDLDCWQHKIGVIEGTLRAYSAPQETMAALEWIKKHVEQDDATPRQDAASTVSDNPDAWGTGRPDTPRGAQQNERSIGEPTKRVRWLPEEEEKVIAMVKDGKNIPTISDHFPNRPYPSVYSLVTRLKAQKRC